MNRPPVAWSRTVAALARTAGWRNVFDSTAWPTHLPGTRWASAASTVSASRLGRRASTVGVGQVVVQPDRLRTTSCSPVRRPRRVERRPVDVLGRGLDTRSRRAAIARDRHAARPRSGGHAAAGRDRALGRGPDERGVLRHHPAGVARRRRRPAPPAGARSPRPATSRSSALRSTSMTISSPSSTRPIGPPSAASGAMWPIISPWVPPENRPSVISATESPRPSPTSAAVTLQHLLHPGPADRPLVADHDDVARHDPLGPDRLVAVGLGVEDPGRTAVQPPLVAGELHDAAVRAPACRAGSRGRRSA